MIEISRENLIDQIRKLAKVKCAPIIGIDGMAAAGKSTLAEELASLLTRGHVVVIMKLSQCTDEIHRFMQANRQHEFHYYENVGTINELHSINYKDIIQKEYPYFSLMIIRPGKQLA